MPATDSDLLAMQRALALARQNPAAPFGAVIYDHSTGAIVAEGLNHIADAQIWHGEIDAIAKAAATHPNWATLCLVTPPNPAPCANRRFFGLASVGWSMVLPSERFNPWAGIKLIFCRMR
ncbi:tRNA-specific adenosine deaminase [Tuwongella immobilis]|uniref:hypothetical protein n=1 Tax=Tuwongella immobilis TaxID=692036 RepID=UPI001E496CD1|nr:hypothetical protein [Tuwongella immobilis]